jgi:hypothetical protein
VAISPAKRHLIRAAAAAGTAVADPRAAARYAGATASEYQLQRARLGVDLRRLKEIQSRERKIELKRELLPGYVDWIDGVLAAEALGKGGAEDDVLVHIMIWRIDVGDFAGALPLAAYVLKHTLPLPERFNRTPATLIAEETAEAALKALGQDNGTFDVAVLLAVDDLVDVHDMPDQVRAKLEKATGFAIARRADAIEPDADGPAGGRGAALSRALRYLKRAQALDPGCGVKKEIQRLERALRKDTAAEPETDTTGAG